MYFQSNASLVRMRDHLPRLGGALVFTVLFLFAMPAARADVFLLGFSGGISGSGVLATQDPCSHIPDPAVWWAVGPVVDVCPVDEWVSLDIGIYSPETGFTHWSLGSLNYDYYEMYPGSVLPPFFYPDELRFSGTHLVQIVNDPTCGWCNGQYLSEYLEFGGGSTGYATVFFNNYDPISRGTLTVTHVPEPSAVGLILIVAAMLGWHSRRSRSRRPFRSPA